MSPVSIKAQMVLALLLAMVQADGGRRVLLSEIEPMWFDPNLVNSEIFFVFSVACDAMTTDYYAGRGARSRRVLEAIRRLEPTTRKQSR